MKRALILAAHPDDEVLGCGGTISKYKKECEFKVVFIGEGSSCRYKDINSKDSKDAILQRTGLAIKSLNILGIKNVEFNNLSCGRLDHVPIIEVNKIIEKSILEFNPDTVFTHSKNDTNNDHKIVFNSTLMATRPGALNNISRLFSYEVLSSSEWSFLEVFKPNFFEDIDENALNDKLKALEFYFN